MNQKWADTYLIAGGWARTSILINKIKNSLTSMSMKEKCAEGDFELELLMVFEEES